MHAAAALRAGGFTGDDLKEIILQQAVYCGVPAAHAALAAIEDLVSRE
jgi:alkylhydroperoxidase/carboxymuconolactone decarboxylase family protein YurZ